MGRESEDQENNSSEFMNFFESDRLKIAWKKRLTKTVLMLVRLSLNAFK